MPKQPSTSSVPSALPLPRTPIYGLAAYLNSQALAEKRESKPKPVGHAPSAMPSKLPISFLQRLDDRQASA